MWPGSTNSIGIDENDIAAVSHHDFDDFIDGIGQNRRLFAVAIVARFERAKRHFAFYNARALHIIALDQKRVNAPGVGVFPNFGEAKRGFVHADGFF